MISLDRSNFNLIEKNGHIETTKLNLKVEAAIKKVSTKLSEIDFHDFDVMVKLSGQLYNSIEPFRFVECNIFPDFTPDDVHTEIQNILKTEFDSCLDHLQ